MEDHSAILNKIDQEGTSHMLHYKQQCWLIKNGQSQYLQNLQLGFKDEKFTNASYLNIRDISATEYIYSMLPVDVQ